MHIHIGQGGEIAVESALDPTMRGYDTLFKHQNSLDQRCDTGSLKSQTTKNNRSEWSSYRFPMTNIGLHRADVKRMILLVGPSEYL